MGKAAGRAPLDAMRFFEVAARHQSFAGAARELGVTPGAVSHRVRKLEAYLGVARFERQLHGLALSGSRLSALGSRLSALGSRLSALGSRLSALGSRLSALGSRLSALGSRLSALGSRLSALGSRLSALGSRLSALGSRLSALGSRLSALGSRLSALSTYGKTRVLRPRPAHPQHRRASAPIRRRVERTLTPPPSHRQRGSSLHSSRPC